MNIEEAMTLYREVDYDSGFEHRGYPACVEHLDGVVAIADESDDGSSLEMFRADVFIQWMETAAREFASGEFESLRESVGENTPRPDRAESH